MNTRTFCIAATLLLCLAVRIDAAIRTFQVAGNWSLQSNWQGSTKPVTGDDVVISANCTVDENIAAYTFSTLTVNAGANLQLMQYQLLVSGAITNNGFIYTECTSYPPIPAGKSWGSYVFFSATGPQTVPPGTYYCLKTSASGSSRTVSAGGDITVTYELYVEGFTNTNQVIFDLGQWQLLGSPSYTYVTGRLRTANTSTAPLPPGKRWYSNMPMRQGVVEFYAASPQYIPGGQYDDDVVLSGGTKTLNGVMYSNGILTLAQVVLVILDSNAVIGSTGSISPGPSIFSSANMIATMGSAGLVRQFNSGGTFTYPIGELTGTAEYSPVTLTFPAVAGSFSVLVRTVNTKHPQNTATVSYINRYWSIDVSSSTTARPGNAALTYTDADVVGPENDMYTGQWVGGPWLQRNKADTLLNQLGATAVLLTGDFTGYGLPPVLTCTIDARVLLQGPAIDSSGTMRTTLNSAHLLPLQQPYGGAPWSYAGTETLTAIPAQVVDWVLLELRSSPTGSAVARRAGLLLASGVITDTNGTSPVSFLSLTTGNYYLIVRHRNHLAVMSAGALTVSQTTPRYDFTTALGQAYGSDAMIGLANGRPPFALWGGDANADGRLKYIGSGNDPASIMARIGGTDITSTATGYYREDADMNGVVQFSGAGNDRAMILRNIGGVDIANQRASQVP